MLHQTEFPSTGTIPMDPEDTFHNDIELKVGEVLVNEMDEVIGKIKFQESKNGSVYNLKNFNQEYGWIEKPDRDPLRQRLIRRVKDKNNCSRNCLWTFLCSILPILQWLPKYSWRKNIVVDIMGGLTVGVMSIPQGMAYARLAGIPPVHGLYMNIIPPIVYMILGSGRHASMGAVTVMSLMTGAVRYKFLPCEDCWKTRLGSNSSLKNGTIEDEFSDVLPIDIGSSVAFLVGIFLIIMGLIRLDVLTTYLSDQVVTGFTVGAAVHIFTAQLDATFGLKLQKTSGPGKIILDYIHLFQIIHKTNFATMIISWSSVAFLIVLKLFINPRVQPKIRLPLPGELFVVIVGILVSYFVNVHQVYDVKIVDFIPSIFPFPSAPRVDVMREVAVDAFLIAVLTYVQSISQVKLYGKLHHYKVDGQQEFFAYGAMNFVSSFFQCFNSGLSVSRTIVFEKTGAKTQLASLFGTAIVILTILFISPYLALLPQGILASIIIVACVDLFRQLKELKFLWKVSKMDFCIYVVTVLAIVLLDVTYGLLFSVLFAFFTVVIRTQCRSVAVVGIAHGSDVYAEIGRYSLIKEIPGVKILHFGAPLYYANVDAFKAKVYKKCFMTTNDDNGSASNSNNNNNNNNINPISDSMEDLSPKHIIIDCSGFAYVDLMGVNTLKQIFLDLKLMGCKLWLAQINGAVQETLQKSNFFELVPRENIFVTVRDAVLHALESDKNNNKAIMETSCS